MVWKNSVKFVPLMGATTRHDIATDATRQPETGDELRIRLGVQVRTMQRRWRDTFNEPFASRQICTAEQVAKMEVVCSEKPKKKSLIEVYPLKEGSEPGANVPPVSVPKKVAEANDIETVKIIHGFHGRKIALSLALITPTLASVSNTFFVSHALSNSAWTAALITGVASTTSILFLWAGVRGIGAWFVVAATLGFEGFCNSCNVFKALMGNMAYSLTTVSGKPSEFLDMVANFTGKDHQDAATWVSIFTAAMICGAQVSAIYELKK